MIWSQHSTAEKRWDEMKEKKRMMIINQSHFEVKEMEMRLWQWQSEIIAYIAPLSASKDHFIHHHSWSRSWTGNQSAAIIATRQTCDWVWLIKPKELWSSLLWHDGQRTMSVQNCRWCWGCFRFRYECRCAVLRLSALKGIRVDIVVTDSVHNHPILQYVLITP